MAGHGGRRPGAGRKKQYTGEEQEVPAGTVKMDDPLRGSPLDYMLAQMRNRKNDPAVRRAMAVAAAPYVHPRLVAAKLEGNIQHGHNHTVTITVQEADRRIEELFSGGETIDVTPSSEDGLVLPAVVHPEPE